MQRLLNPDIVPPDGFRYRAPETGHWSIKETHTDWIADAYEHLVGNKLQVPPNLRQTMEEQLCSVLPEGWCEEYDPNRVIPITRIHRGDVLDGMKVFSTWLFKGSPYVPQAEAERRASICANCYLNVQVQGCSSCHQIADELTRNVKTKLDDRLIACSVCKCLLRAKVWFPQKVLETTDSDWKQTNYPNFCWLKKGGKNYARPEKSKA